MTACGYAPCVFGASMIQTIINQQSIAVCISTHRYGADGNRWKWRNYLESSE